MFTTYVEYAKTFLLLVFSSDNQFLFYTYIDKQNDYEDNEFRR